LTASALPAPPAANLNPTFLPLIPLWGFFRVSFLCPSLGRSAPMASPFLSAYLAGILCLLPLKSAFRTACCRPSFNSQCPSPTTFPFSRFLSPGEFTITFLHSSHSRPLRHLVQPVKVRHTTQVEVFPLEPLNVFIPQAFPFILCPPADPWPLFPVHPCELVPNSFPI